MTVMVDPEVEVMISYATRARSGVAQRLRDQLANRAMVPRLDQVDLETGRPWRPTIHAWLDSCHFAIALLTPAALDSAWVRFELDVLAHRFWRPAEGLDGLLLVLLDGVTLEDLDMPWADPGQLAGVQTGLVFDEDASDDDVANFVVESLGRLVGSSVHRPAPAPIRFRAHHHAKPLLPEMQIPLGKAAQDLAIADPSIEAACRRRCAELDELREVVALELSRAARPWVGIGPLLNRMQSAEDANDLVDLNLCAFFDARACASILSDSSPRAVVLGCVDAGAAQLALWAALSSRWAKDMRDRKVLSVELADDGSALAASIRRGIDDEEWYEPGVDVDDALRTGADPEIGDVAYVIVSVVEPAWVLEDLHRLVQRELPVGLLFVANQPALLADRLGLPLVGPDPAVLQDYVDASRALVDRRSTLRKQIRYEAGRQRFRFGGGR